jgi:hypothetical protein
LGLGTRPGWVGRCALTAVISGIVIVAAGWTFALAHRAADQDAVAVDFKISVWSSGRAVLDGRSPMAHYSSGGYDDGTVYPPIATIATLPFSLPPYQVARILWMLALSAAVVGSLWLCGVRDWRCYVAACASPPVVAGLLYANLSLLLVLAVALAWRWRDRPWLVGALLGLVVAMKLFLWPVAVWLALVRRRLAFALAIGVAGVLSLAGWAAVGFAELTEYPTMMQHHADVNDQDGVSVAALAAQLGVPGNQLVALAAGVAALMVAWRLRRDELGAFAWAVTAALLASPMVWWHYFALLLVPLALAAPTWGIVWLSPFAMFPQAADALVGIALSVFVARFASRRDVRSVERGRPSPIPARTMPAPTTALVAPSTAS